MKISSQIIKKDSNSSKTSTNSDKKKRKSGKRSRSQSKGKNKRKGLITNLKRVKKNRKGNKKENKKEKKRFDLLIADNFKPEPSFMNLENYELGGLIGEGAYAFVRIAIHKPTNTQVAVKIYEKRRLIGLRRNLKREVKLLIAINHKNIIKLLAYFASANHIYLIMEYGGELSLYDYLKQQKYYTMKEEECRKVRFIFFLYFKGFLLTDERDYISAYKSDIS